MRCRWRDTGDRGVLICHRCVCVLAGVGVFGLGWGSTETQEGNTTLEAQVSRK